MTAVHCVSKRSEDVGQTLRIEVFDWNQIRDDVLQLVRDGDRFIRAATSMIEANIL